MLLYAVQQRHNKRVANIDYDAYIASDTWKQRKAAAIARTGYKCVLCSSQDQLDVHHNTYARLGDELANDLAG